MAGLSSLSWLMPRCSPPPPPPPPPPPLLSVFKIVVRSHLCPIVQAPLATHVLCGYAVGSGQWILRVLVLSAGVIVFLACRNPAVPKFCPRPNISEDGIGLPKQLQSASQDDHCLASTAGRYKKAVGYHQQKHVNLLTCIEQNLGGENVQYQKQLFIRGEPRRELGESRICSWLPYHLAIPPFPRLKRQSHRLSSREDPPCCFVQATPAAHPIVCPTARGWAASYCQGPTRPCGGPAEATGSCREAARGLLLSKRGDLSPLRLT